MLLSVIGLGDLGSGIGAGLVRAGHRVAGVDPSPLARERWAATGQAAVASLDQVAWPEVSGVFVVVLLTSQVEETLRRLRALIGESGAARPVYVISTLQADFARGLGDFSAPGLRVVEAPISGGSAGARAGRLSVMLGGPVTDDDVTLFKSTVASEVTVFEGFGEATVAKLLNNAIMAIQVRVVADALELSERLGLDAGRLYQFLQHASGSSQAAVKFRALNAKILDKDVKLLLESFPSSESAGLFGQALPSIEGLEEKAAPARALLDARLPSADHPR